MIFKDYYKILGLESNKASYEEIKDAYREKAKKYHPDMNVGDNSSEEIFKDINEAYRTLSNEKLRRKYDFNWNRYIGKKERNKNQKPEKRTVKELLLDIFFGASIKTPKVPKANSIIYGENINTEINVTLQEAFFGAKKVVKLRTVEGKETSFNFSVPAGIQNNDKIRIVGKGKPGKNGGKNGDLFIIINIINDKYLRLNGNDIIMELPLKTYEAALGTKKEINLFEEKISIIIPECTSSGNCFKIEGKGYKTGFGTRGNLEIIPKIVLPKQMDEKTKAIYNELKNAEKRGK